MAVVVLECEAEIIMRLGGRWVEAYGLSVTLDDTKAVQPIFDSPYINSEGESLTFDLIVTNQIDLRIITFEN